MGEWWVGSSMFMIGWLFCFFSIFFVLMICSCIFIMVFSVVSNVVMGCGVFWMRVQFICIGL